MRDLNELNTRLELLLGNRVANDIICDAQQRAIGEAIQYGCNPSGVEKQLFLYENILDQVLTHYELRGGEYK